MTQVKIVAPHAEEHPVEEHPGVGRHHAGTPLDVIHPEEILQEEILQGEELQDAVNGQGGGTTHVAILE
ncbi:hypothetical protein J7E79_28735 [Bacillus sp. ISL-40]|uniref:hypothetical protein n=1 Tax=Bacillus sp. ISL-40 TaxID=2819126 RepID=UPI001BE6293D|nr:hypothetical protein [Bacillus sp. ISL-40]MBT2701262.1 hypothetical protein [Bacillus sp. ISL-40]